MQRTTFISTIATSFGLLLSTSRSRRPLIMFFHTTSAILFAILLSRADAIPLAIRDSSPSDADLFASCPGGGGKPLFDVDSYVFTLRRIIYRLS